MTTANQNRIEGDYCIVSAWREKHDLLTNHLATNNAVLQAHQAGCGVTMCIGWWNGKQEISLKITGVNARYEALNIAKNYNQDAYLTVSDGTARLYSRYSEEITVFNAEYEGLKDGCGTELANGYQFHFGVK